MTLSSAERAIFSARVKLGLAAYKANSLNPLLLIQKSTFKFIVTPVPLALSSGYSGGLRAGPGLSERISYSLVNRDQLSYSWVNRDQPLPMSSAYCFPIDGVKNTFGWTGTQTGSLFSKLEHDIILFGCSLWSERSCSQSCGLSAEWNVCIWVLLFICLRSVSALRI